MTEVELAVLKERERLADLIQVYPVFAYDGDTGELLKLRDAIGEAIRKNNRAGEMIQ